MKICTKCGGNNLSAGVWCSFCNAKANRNRLVRLKSEAFRILGGDSPKCKCCGEWRRELLSIDHVVGKIGREKNYYGISLYAHVVKLFKEGFPLSNYRILCFNCNLSRGFYGYCPHEKERENDEQARQIASTSGPNTFVVKSSRERDIW